MPQIIQVARKYGVTGGINEAVLRRWEHGYQDWTLKVKNKEIAIVAMTGEKITGELIKYAADYNA